MSTESPSLSPRAAAAASSSSGSPYPLAPEREESTRYGALALQKIHKQLFKLTHPGQPKADFRTHFKSADHFSQIQAMNQFSEIFHGVRREALETDFTDLLKELLQTFLPTVDPALDYTLLIEVNEKSRATPNFGFLKGNAGLNQEGPIVTMVLDDEFQPFKITQEELICGQRRENVTHVNPAEHCPVTITIQTSPKAGSSRGLDPTERSRCSCAPLSWCCTAFKVLAYAAVTIATVGVVSSGVVNHFPDSIEVLPEMAQTAVTESADYFDMLWNDTSTFVTNQALPFVGRAWNSTSSFVSDKWSEYNS